VGVFQPIFTDTMCNMIDKTVLEKYSSADLIVYPKQGRVNIGSEVVRLGPVNMRVLVMLLENQGQVVSRSKLLDTVWKNQIISDDTLTRCISDIRIQLGKFSKQDKLIETIPKRGYQWLPKVNQVEKISKDQSREDFQAIAAQTKPIFYWLLAGLIGMLVLSTSFLWVASQFFVNDKVSIALMPIQATDKNLNLAYDIEDILRSKVLSTKKLRYLSSTALNPNQIDSFSHLYNEFGAHWMIEGRLRDYNNQVKVTLSLVDMRTALVVHSETFEIKQELKETRSFCEGFVQKTLKVLDL
jgi:DNA-binding winged helix-turn-helix (wHTH) protein/TolB-like protein